MRDLHTMVSMDTQELIQRIDERLQVLNGEITVLTVARQVLLDGRVPTTTSTRSTRRTRRRSPNRRRGADVLLAGTAVRMLSENDGLTTSALATQANADSRQALPLLKELEAAGQVRRTGERRATRWHAVTDEDRVQQRAAELASRSGRQGKK